MSGPIIGEGLAHHYFLRELKMCKTVSRMEGVHIPRIFKTGHVRVPHVLGDGEKQQQQQFFIGTLAPVF